MGPGDSVVLTSTPVSFDATQTIWLGAFAPGTTDLYLYVDSWNPGHTIGTVLERDETNNRFEMHGLTVSGEGVTGVDPPSEYPDFLPRTVLE